MTPKFTHVGAMVGCDARTKDGYQRTVKLRATKLFWISEHGLKFKRESGRGVGDWPVYRIVVETVKELT